MEIGEKLQRNKKSILLCFSATGMSEAAREAPYTKGRLSGEEVRIFSGSLLKVVLLIQKKDGNM